MLSRIIRIVEWWSLTGLTSCVSAQNVSTLFPCSKVMESPYGVCTHISRVNWDWELRNEELQRMKEAGIEWVRTDIELNTIRPIPPADTIRTDVYFPMLESIDSFDTKTLAVLCNGKGKDYAWNDRKKYSIFLDHVVKTYSDRLFYWEVINEVDHIKDDKGYCKGYVDVLNEVYTKFKYKNKKCTILLSGLADVRRPFADSLFYYGAQKYCDIINIHTYDSPEALPNHFQRIKELMDKNNFSKSVWLTECGMDTAIDSIRHIETNEREKVQAQRLPRIFIISFAYGIDKVFWYNLKSREQNPYYNEDNFGLLHHDLSPKPSFLAYTALIKMCPKGSTRPTMEQKGNLYLSSWETPLGVKMYAVWAEKGFVQKDCLDFEGTGKIYDMFGKKNKNFIISESVTYLAGFKNISFK